MRPGNSASSVPNCSAICSGAWFGSMIPPALTLVFFGLAAGADIGELFTASFLPGLLMAAIFIAYVQVRIRLNPALAPAADGGTRLSFRPAGPLSALC